MNTLHFSKQMPLEKFDSSSSVATQPLYDSYSQMTKTSSLLNLLYSKIGSIL